MAELRDKDEQYSVFMKYKQKKNDEDNEESGGFNPFKLIIIAVVMVLLTLLALYVTNNYNEVSNKIEELTGGKISLGHKDELDIAPSKFSFKMLSKYQNILLLGVDSNGPDTLPFSGVRSDTMIVLSVNLHDKSVNAVSIPRDSKVYLADAHGVNKINAAYALGGIELTKKTIEETFGIKIHNYVIVNAEGVRKLIDVIGGVPIHIDQNMHYHDYTANLHVDFNKGDYVLNGKQAEEYLRFRKDMLGDIGRVHRQQKFIKALLEQLKTPEAVRKIPEALKIAGLYTRTDLNLYQMSQYASIAHEIDLNKVKQLFRNVVGLTNSDKQAVEKVVLRFHPSQKSYIQSVPIHRQQKQLADNETEFTIQLLVKPNFELKQQVLKYGSLVEVLQPKTLRQEVKQEHQKALKLYKRIDDRKEKREKIIENRIKKINCLFQRILSLRRVREVYD